MTQKHTPGPWDLYKSPDANGAWEIGTGEWCGNHFSDLQIATAHGWYSEAEADARLIAAAPEMHDDLRSAWAVLSIILENGWVPEQHRAPVEQCRDNAARSLARARGETA